MKLTFLLLLLIIFPNLVPANFKITSLTNNPGILPFSLGKAKLINRNHIFLYYYKLDALEMQINNLNTFYDNLNDSIHKDIPISLTPSIINSYNNLKPLILEVNEKYQTLVLSSNRYRNKRGLFNALGSFNKFLTGSLDADDGERYNKAIQNLEQNQQEIVYEVNSRISLFKNLSDNYLNTVQKLVNNQNNIKHYLEEYKQALNSEIDDFYSNVVFLSLINQILTSTDILVTILDNIENAVVFSRLNLIHPDILKPKDLPLILNALSKFYSQEEISYINIYNWYSIIKTSCYFSNNSLIFALKIPITSLETFDYYHLYPIPTNENLILIPPNPYIALSTYFHQFMESPCEKIGELYFCTQKNMLTNEDCITSLIEGTPKNCKYTEVSPVVQSIEKIDEKFLIISSTNPIKVKQSCKDEEYTFIKGINLVEIPFNCSIEVKNHVYGDWLSTINAKPLILPKLTTDVLKPNNLSIGKIQLDNINLSELHKLKKNMDFISPFHIEKFEKYTKINWILWTMATATVLIAVGGYTIIKLASRKKKNVPAPASVLFSPEAIV